MRSKTMWLVFVSIFTRRWSTRRGLAPTCSISVIFIRYSVTFEQWRDSSLCYN